MYGLYVLDCERLLDHALDGNHGLAFLFQGVSHLD